MTTRRRGPRWCSIAGLALFAALASACATSGGDVRGRWAVDTSDVEVYGERSALQLVLSREAPTEGSLAARARAAARRAAVQELEARGAVVVDSSRAERVLHLDWIAIDSEELGVARVRVAGRKGDGPRRVVERDARAGPTLGTLCLCANVCCAAPVSIPAAIVFLAGLFTPAGLFGAGLVPSLVALGVLVGVNAPGLIAWAGDAALYAGSGGDEPPLTRAVEQLIEGEGEPAPDTPDAPPLRERPGRGRERPELPDDDDGDLLQVLAY